MLTHTKLLFFLYIEITSWNCNITCLIRIVCTISSAVTTDYWRPRQNNSPPSAAFLFNEDSEYVENTCNLARLGKSWNEFNFFQACKIDLWNKMRTLIELIGIRILKELKEIKLWRDLKRFEEIKVKLLIDIK